jgi:putative membrane protein
MKRASKLFSQDDHKAVTDAVKQAESLTSAEIIPVVTTASGRYDRAEDIVGLWLGLGALAVVWLLFQDTRMGDWSGVNLVINLPIVIGVVFGGWVAGVVIANRIGWLRRLFTPRRELREEVEQGARKAFFDSRVHHTQGATGVLIYVSLFEHVAVVLADREVTEKLGQEKLDALCKDLTGALAGRRYTEAFVNTIGEAGKALGAVLPRQDDDKNELDDALVVID